MATYREFDDDLLTCPYDPNHRVARRRFQIHINDCGKKSASQQEMFTCRYNQSHRFPKTAEAIHYMTCPDAKRELRGVMEQRSVAQKEESSGPFKLPVIGRTSNTPSNDPWAEEGERDGVENFSIKGLKEESIDIDSLCDINTHTDNIQIQRLTHAQRKFVTDTRNKRITDLKNESRASSGGSTPSQVPYGDQLMESIASPPPAAPESRSISGIGRGVRIGSSTIVSPGIPTNEVTKDGIKNMFNGW